MRRLKIADRSNPPTVSPGRQTLLWHYCLADASVRCYRGDIVNIMRYPFDGSKARTVLVETEEELEMILNP